MLSLLCVFLCRHPWSFITVKGNASSAVEDHAVYQGEPLLPTCLPSDGEQTAAQKGNILKVSWCWCFVCVCVFRNQGFVWGQELSGVSLRLRRAFHHHHHQSVGSRYKHASTPPLNTHNHDSFSGSGWFMPVSSWWTSKTYWNISVNFFLIYSLWWCISFFCGAQQQRFGRIGAVNFQNRQKPAFICEQYFYKVRMH